MFKLSFLFLFINITFKFAIAQKAVIDSSVFEKWPSVDVPIRGVSNDGKYVISRVSYHNQPYKTNTTIVKSTFNSWRSEMENISSVEFTSDSKCLVFQKKDSLCIQVLGTDSIECIRQVASYKLPSNDNGHWIAYLGNGVEKVLTLRSLINNREISFKQVTDFLFDDGGSCLVIKRSNNKYEETLECVDLSDLSVITFWSGEKAKYIIFNTNGNQLVFLSESSLNKNLTSSIWHYKRGLQSATLVINDSSLNLGENYRINSLSRFTANDKAFFFTLKKENNDIKLNSNPVQVDVWSYTDLKVQSQQLKELRNQRNYGAVVHFDNRKVIQIEREDDHLRLNRGYCFKEDFVLLTTSHGGDGDTEWNWNRSATESIYVVDINTGEKKIISENINQYTSLTYSISPFGTFVVYYDPFEKAYFNYNLITGKKKNISGNIKTTWTTYREYDVPSAPYRPIGLAGWLPDNKGVLMYDQWDIFQLDPFGIKPPINLTRGIGKENNIVFRLAEDYLTKGVISDSILILSAFNLNNKNDGFYQININNNAGPTYLTMQSCIFKGFGESHDVPNSYLRRAKHANIYVTRRMTASEYPNFYFTTDFKGFHPVTQINPEKSYNWMTTELIKWRTYDGIISHGVLYKPENFDSSKKYPVIIHYYERMSDGLNAFLKPQSCWGPINIPYFVSNGYLVFTPDIHYKIGTPGQSVVNTVVSAAKHLASFAWVDLKRMGIQGHSRGGWETNYLVTHSNIFAAAMSSSGMSDYISLYLTVRDLSDGTARNAGHEFKAQRIGNSLWERPDLYIKNSPVFNAHKVTTPILMMSNKGDADVPFQQGLEFFMALRRNGKKAWMLQYDGEDHLVFGKQAEDLTIRIKQFFDHYLKGSPAPKWMTRGVPAKMKGQDDGLQLDYEKTPGEGLNAKKP